MTRVCTVLAGCAVIAVMWVSESRLKEAAGTEPKATSVASVNPVPLIVAAVSPEVSPELGDALVTVGVGFCPKWAYRVVERGPSPRRVRRLVLLMTWVPPVAAVDQPVKWYPGSEVGPEGREAPTRPA